MAAEPVWRESFGRAGRARVRERFGLDRMVEETLAVYEEVRAGHPATRS
jgi:glycosyltransferase involved in cell wall biosynthesis